MKTAGVSENLPPWVAADKKPSATALPCACSCHTNPGEMHALPCCHWGWAELPDSIGRRMRIISTGDSLIRPEGDKWRHTVKIHHEDGSVTERSELLDEHPFWKTHNEG